MALVHSASLKLGKTLEHFELEDPNGKRFKSQELFGKGGFMIAVMCNHCPYSNAIWKRLITVAEFAKKLDIGTVAINPNIHPNYPEDSPSHMLDKIAEMNIDFPYLIDENQDVAKNLGAVCTPDLFLFDGDAKLYYHGRLDDNWQDARSVKEEELREAVMMLFSKQDAPKVQHPSQGCSIKWINTVTG